MTKTISSFQYVLAVEGLDFISLMSIVRGCWKIFMFICSIGKIRCIVVEVGIEFVIDGVLDVVDPVFGQGTSMEMFMLVNVVSEDVIASYMFDSL